jgi:aarF domain-containing kinase
MAGKRVLDAVALFNASRTVAYQHLSIRLRQLDVYSKTSTLAKAARSKTSSGARSTLSPAPRPSSSANVASSRHTYSSNSDSAAEQIPSVESVQHENDANKRVEGLEQDHHYRPEDNSVVDAVPNKELDVQQEKAQRHPLPDGTIPAAEAANDTTKTHTDFYNQRSATEHVKQPLEQRGSPSTSLKPESSSRSSIPDPDADNAEQSDLSSEDAMILQQQSEFQIPSTVAEPPREAAYEVKGSANDEGPEIGVDQEKDTFYRAPQSNSPVLSALPRVKLPKNTGSVQGGDSHIKGNVNADVFYSSGDRGEGAAISKQLDSHEPEEPSKETVNQIFHSPRVARILGSKGQMGSLKPKEGNSPRHSSTLSRQGKDREVSTVSAGSAEVTPGDRGGIVKRASGTRREKDSIAKLAADVEKDARAPAKVSKAEPWVPHFADQLTGHPQMSSEGNTVGGPAPFEMRESRVPSSRFGRVWQYGGLAASMAFGAAGEGLKRATGSVAGSDGSLMLSAGNMERLVAKLSKMRGAALKLGQMMSFQGQKQPLYQYFKKLTCS